VKTNAQRAFAAIGSVALIAAAFGLGYRAAHPDAGHSEADGSGAASAVRAALAQPNEIERAAGLAPILVSLDAQHLDAIVAAYEATFTSVGPGAVAMEMLAEAWSRIDPAGALQRIEGWKPYRRGSALPLLMRSWARRDVASARAAIETIEPAELRDSAAAAVILGWADSRDPAVWDAYVAGLPFGRAAEYDLMRRIGAHDGADALLRRAESLPEDAPDGFRRFAMRDAVDIAAQTDLDRAMAFAERHGLEDADLVRIVAKRWGATDGRSATQWAMSHLTGQGHNRALRAAFESWLRSDDERAALDWVTHQSDEVVAGVLDLYANALGKTDPKRALEISAGIADPNERRRIQTRLARNWLARQPRVAASWLEQNGLADLLAMNRSGPKPQTAPVPPNGQPGDGKVE